MTYIIGIKRPADVILTFNGYEPHLREESTYRVVLNRLLAVRPSASITILVPNQVVLMPNLTLMHPENFVGMLMKAFDVKELKDFPCAIRHQSFVQKWPCVLMYRRRAAVRAFIFEQSCTQMIPRNRAWANVYWKNFGH